MQKENIERQYIKQLLEELETAEQKTKETSENHYSEVIDKLDKTQNQYELIQSKNKKIEKEKTELELKMKVLKSQLKDKEKELAEMNTKIEKIRKPVISGGEALTESPEDIFPFFLQEGGIPPKSNPFECRINNKGIIFSNSKPIVKYSITEDKISFQRINALRNKLFWEICNYLNIHKSAFDMSIKPYKGKFKKFKHWTKGAFFKLKPIYDKQNKMFISNIKTKYVYSKNDGSKFLLAEDGVIEYL